ncbi:MAG TPA: DEAD/DEAH box helicase [Candidatus Latescibacteria bacterium]|nr:DEAD/DEAH box helicase [Candidatus Handelsmanbacteria bacterium]HIL09405.1 DEAD/DEAH box helicase [Candidatus Latescibacterota bacterium]
MAAFSELGILPALESALAMDDITDPTPIQSKAIPVLLAGADAYVSSETGTGKTLAYLLPVLARVDAAQRALQVVIVVPTHELAMQICDVGRELAQKAGLGIRFQPLIGGVSTKRQLEKLKDKPQVIVGTPGRIDELITGRKIKPHTVKSVIVDEVDRLLLGESLAEVRSIIKSTLLERQLVFVSATQRAETTEEAEALASDLVQVSAGGDQVNTAIEHFYIECEERDKAEVLRKLLHALEPVRAIVFMHRSANAEILASKLTHHKIPVVDLHGAKDNAQRKKAMDDFRAGEAKVLIASDIAARGLDIRGVSHVFNFDIPTQSKDYLHRVGRTSRAGSQGCAVSIMTAQEVRLAKRYQSDLRIEVRVGRLAGGIFHVDN